MNPRRNLLLPQKSRVIQAAAMAQDLHCSRWAIAGAIANRDLLCHFSDRNTVVEIPTSMESWFASRTATPLLSPPFGQGLEAGHNGRQV